MSKWNVDAGGAWSSPSNWQDGIPRVAGATANLTDAIQSSRTLTVDVPVTLGTLTFDNVQGYVLAGPQAITIDTASDGGGAIVVLNGSHRVTVPVTLARDTTVFVNNSSDLLKLSGNLTVASGVTIGKEGLGTLEVTNVRAFGLNVSAGRVHIKPSGGSFAGVSRIEQINIAGGAVLDLADNKLITPIPAGSWTGAAYDGIAGLVQSGRNGGGWGGSGIVTSQSIAVSGNYHSLGVARASDVRPNTATETALWAGQTITGSDTLVMYTYGGDANLDGKLNVDDYIKIDIGIAAGLTGWANGDFNYDGKVNIDDYTTIIDANIGIQNGVFPTASGSSSVVAVPEPVFGCAMLLMFTSLHRRRRR
jgi:hypothetical protein